MKTIELTDLVIERIEIDYKALCVRVTYSMVDADGISWGGQGHAIFWVTMPPPPYPLDIIPDHWFLLPASYIPTFVQLQADADAALSAKYLV